MLEPTNHREPNRPREPELPVDRGSAEPGEPKIPEMPPPVPDPPEIVGSRLASASEAEVRSVGVSTSASRSLAASGSVSTKRAPDTPLAAASEPPCLAAM